MIGRISLTYVTGNKIKFQVASHVMSGSGIDLVQVNLQVPEIQSPHVEEVVKHSAIWANQQIDEPFVITDAGFYIEALNGFPGPFARHTNDWLSAEDYLNLMVGREDRRVTVRECLAYCVPAEEPVLFCQTHEGQLAVKAGREDGTSMNQLFIPAGYTDPLSEMSTDQRLTFWLKTSVWHRLKEHFASKA